MALLPNESRDLRKKYKRLIWFLLAVFIFDVFICFLFFEYTSMNKVLAGFIVICITAILYLLFSLICAKIDKKKQKRLEENKNKDPFTNE